MSTRQRNWNQFEAVILLDGFLNFLCGSVSREEAVSLVSQDLREMARQQGEEIDETFRNEAGISLQMHRMESAFSGQTVSLEATKLFLETVKIYRRNNSEYKRLLETARGLISGERFFNESNESSLKTEFMNFLGTKMSPEQINEAFWCYGEIEKYCLKKGLLEKPLFETRDLIRLKNIKDEIEKNPSFRFTHRGTNTKIVASFYYYYTFIRAKAKEEKNAARLTSKEVVSLVRTNSDERLLKKYPVIFKRIFYALRNSATREDGLTLDEINNLTKQIARVSEIEDILDNASWADSKDDKYWFSNDIVDHNIVESESTTEETNAEKGVDVSQMESNNQRVRVVDFENLENLALTIPEYFTYFDEKYGSFSKWEELYIAVIVVLYDDYPHVFKNGMSFSSNAEQIDLAMQDQSMYMLAPRLVAGTNYVVETQISPNDIIQKIKYLLDKCTVDYENVNIFYYSNVMVENFSQEGEEQARTEQNAKCTTETTGRFDSGHAQKNYHNEPYETILKEKFHQGFRMNSSIEIRRFRKAYIDAFNKELQENDTEITDIIYRLCIINKDRAYLPEEILSDELTVKLLDYINKSFDAGKTMLYYSALCDEFEEDFLDYPLHNNPELLRQYLEVIGNNKYYLNKNFISQDSNATSDLLTEIRSCLKEHAHPMKYKKIFEVLPHLPQDKVIRLLRSNKEFVENGREEYFHESIVQLSDVELKNIAEIIDLTIEEKDFISGNELYSAIEEKYPYIIDQNQEISVLGFRGVLKVKFGTQYSFIGNIISRAGQQLSMANVFGNFAKSKDSFTLTELKAFADELGNTIYFEPVYENSLRISQEQFVSNTQAYFAISETDDVLDIICPGNYISIQNVTNFGIFPDAGYPWNKFLLEEFVAEYSERYKLLHLGYNQYECVGAIAKRSAGYNSFEDFLVDFLSESDVELKKEPVLDLLANEGYIVRRRYSNIEGILIRAKAQRNSKEVG